MPSSGAEAARPRLILAQEHFYRACHIARYQSAAIPALENQRKELLSRNRQLAQAHGFESLRAQAEQQVSDHPAVPGPAQDRGRARGELLPQPGTATYWLTALPSSVPPLTLVDLHAQQTRRAAFESWLLAGALLGGWFLSFFAGAMACIKLFWPEQIAGLGLVVGSFFGLNWLSIFLVVVGLSGRLLMLSGWLMHRLQRAQPAPAAESGGLISS
jgi:hypothetical protein